LTEELETRIREKFEEALAAVKVLGVPVTAVGAGFEIKIELKDDGKESEN
jgi:hypothetical protein